MEKISRIGMDTSKQIFQLHGVDEAERVVLRRKLRRKEMMAFFAALAPTTIGIEACGGSHHWARELTRLGHEVKLIPPQYVKPYVKRGKNDAADAEAGAEHTAICAACHGADGNSPAPTFPKVAGLGEKYIYKQLLEVKTGVRVIPQMMGILDNNTEQDLWDMAAFYATKELQLAGANPIEVQMNSGEKVDGLALGEKIYRAGNRANGVPACTGCHSPRGLGNDPAGYPRMVVDAIPVSPLVLDNGGAARELAPDPRNAYGETWCGDQMDPVWYALDVMVPLLDLKHQDKCDVSGRDDAWGWRFLKALYALLGAAVTSIYLLAISGVLKRRVET